MENEQEYSFQSRLPAAAIVAVVKLKKVSRGGTVAGGACACVCVCVCVCVRLLFMAKAKVGREAVVRLTTTYCGE